MAFLRPELQPQQHPPPLPHSLPPNLSALGTDGPARCRSGDGSPLDGGVALRLGLAAAIFVTSLLGAWFPIVAKRMSGSVVPDSFYFIAKFFGSGVILATAFIHLLAPAHEAFSNPCLGPWAAAYPWTEAIVLATIVAVFVCEAAVSHNHNNNHDHSHNQDNDRDGPKSGSESAPVPAAAPATAAPDSAPLCRTVARPSNNNKKKDPGSAGRKRSSVCRHGSTRSCPAVCCDDLAAAAAAAPAMTERTCLLLGRDDVADEDSDEDEDGDDTESQDRPAPRRYGTDGAVAVCQRPALFESTAELALPTPSSSPPPSRSLCSSQLTSIYTLEFGVVFHSFFVGLSLAVTPGRDRFVLLASVLTAHQLFEGLGLGARVATAPWPRHDRGRAGVGTWMPYLFGLVFAASTPVALVGAVLVELSAARGGGGGGGDDGGDGAGMVLMTGVVDAIAAGILIYTGLVELLAGEFLAPRGDMATASRGTLWRALGLVVLGAGVMAGLGVWL